MNNNNNNNNKAYNNTLPLFFHALSNQSFYFLARFSRLFLGILHRFAGSPDRLGPAYIVFKSPQDVAVELSAHASDHPRVQFGDVWPSFQERFRADAHLSHQSRLIRLG